MFKFKKNKVSIDKVIEEINKKDLFKRYLSLFIGCTLLSLAFNIFFLPKNIVYGGVTGISIIIKKLFEIDPSLFVLVTSLILLIISYFVLGFEKTKGSIVGSIIYPLCLKLTAPIATYINVDIDDTLLIAIFGGAVAGLGAGINFKSGFTTGGTDIINQIVSKYTKVSIGKAMMMSDGIIVLGAGFFLTNQVYAWENVLLAVVVLYILSLMTDKVILGISQSKAFYIITEHETDIKKFILKHLSHGVTVLDGRGGFTGNNQKVIMCIIPTKEYFIAKEGIHSIDPNAFFLVTDAYEISGGR